MDKSNQKEELTTQNVPKTVNYLINEIAEVRVLLEHIEKQLGLGMDKHRPIRIEDACRILGVAINMLNKMIREISVPHYYRATSPNILLTFKSFIFAA